MKCVYCGDEYQYEHYITCQDAPEFVRYQAMAERRHNGGKVSPISACTDGNRLLATARNFIDRNEPCACQDGMGHKTGGTNG